MLKVTWAVTNPRLVKDPTIVQPASAGVNQSMVLLELEGMLLGLGWDSATIQSTMHFCLWPQLSSWQAFQLSSLISRDIEVFFVGKTATRSLLPGRNWVTRVLFYGTGGRKLRHRKLCRQEVNII